ncbi:expressed unknown protein [Seminavis robusta]|uniref:Sulfotransferase n=1 Tax=Seminavis robusta TaxID=568900 RepID=A0A9N8HUH9_9STRA|nr:expressed unknown protein [Seminavis robusta]|eukprot:Sro1755_g295520.1 n/a (426) ;mRNA; f:8936-10213
MISSSRSARGLLVIVGVVIVFGTTVIVQTHKLEFLRRRTLRSVFLGPRAPWNHTSTANISEGKAFKKTIACELPIPSIDKTGQQKSPRDSDASTCVLFYPERFFNSVGSTYKDQYEISKQVKTEHPVIHMTFKNDTFTTIDKNNAMSSRYPSSLTFLHIRKCAGTTMFRSLSGKSVQVPYTVNKYNRNMIKDMGIIRDIHIRQQRQSAEDSNPDAVVFSFVRDPVIRFLSSVGQIRHMGMGKVKLFRKCHNVLAREATFEEPSLNDRQDEPTNATIEASRALVQCMLDSIKDSITTTSTTNTSSHYTAHELSSPPPPEYNYIEQHMLPQAYELRARSLEHDISIHLMGMKQISSTLQTLVGIGSKNRHARSSRANDYTHGYYLYASILTDEMIADICQIYAVDVLLLKSTGLDSTLCDRVPGVLR